MYGIFRLSPDDLRIRAALDTAKEVFGECISLSCTPEGRRNFINFIDGEKIRRHISDGSMRLYICCEENIICGMMAVLSDGHISLAFVRHKYRKKGIGRQLFERITHDLPRGEYTVNAAPSAIGFYRSLGFRETDMEQIDGGIRYVPMKCAK